MHWKGGEGREGKQALKVGENQVGDGEPLSCTSFYPVPCPLSPIPCYKFSFTIGVCMEADQSELMFKMNI